MIMIARAFAERAAGHWRRREWLLAATALCGCTVPTRRVSGPLDAALAGFVREDGICAAAWCTLARRMPASPSGADGCATAQRSVAPASAVFQAASLTKPVVACATLKLVQQGRLDLDAALTQYLPDGYRRRRQSSGPTSATADDGLPPAVLSALSLRMLLNHTSGLPNWANGPLRLGFEPGSRWRYSGEGYRVLQQVVETATGTGLDEVVASQVFGPLALHDSAMRWREGFTATAVPGHTRRGIVPAARFAQPMAAASLYTTARDYARFMAAWLADDALLALSLARPVTADSRLGLQWGLGWGIETTDNGPLLWQWGNNPGYRAFAMASATTGDGFVLLTNSEGGLALAETMAGAVLPGPHKLFGFHMLR